MHGPPVSKVGPSWGCRGARARYRRIGSPVSCPRAGQPSKGHLPPPPCARLLPANAAPPPATHGAVPMLPAWQSFGHTEMHPVPTLAIRHSAQGPPVRPETPSPQPPPPTPPPRPSPPTQLLEHAQVAVQRLGPPFLGGLADGGGSWAGWLLGGMAVPRRQAVGASCCLLGPRPVRQSSRRVVTDWTLTSLRGTIWPQ